VTTLAPRGIWGLEGPLPEGGSEKRKKRVHHRTKGKLNPNVSKKSKKTGKAQFFDGGEGPMVSQSKKRPAHEPTKGEG